MAFTRNSKRPRTEEAEDGQEGSANEQAEYQRGDVWFEDGNVVLIAQSTAFRLHRGVLSTHSEVFRDMFTVPQPATAELWEGCPVVHLSDLKNDLMHMVKALYFGRQYGLSPYFSMNF